MTSTGRRILLLEDNDQLRALMAEVLDGAGYLVTSAADSHQALTQLARPPQLDLLIADIEVPGMDGDSLGRLARTVQPGLGILLISGQGDAAARRAHGLNATFLAKPFTPTTLLDAVRGLLEARP